MKDVFLPQPFLRAFPAPETVFADQVERYARLINPLVSIDLAAVDPKLSGWIHLVSPIEPDDSYLGTDTKNHWGPYLQPNWLAFRFTADDRYKLLGDFGFFLLESKPYDLLEEWYEEQHTSFEVHKAAFLEGGQVCRIWSSGKPQPTPALSQLGGKAPVTNLTWEDVPGAAFTYSDDDAAPRTSDGRLYQFIGAVPGWHYRDFGADDILLYYDPVERVALQTFVFT